MQEEATCAGFDAISEKVRALYPGKQERHYGVLLPYALGGRDPLDGLDVWESNRGIPHWHYVTYGFTELYEKESEDPEVSGYGFELTFRLKREDGETEPPAWPMNLLQNLARYVFSSGNVFGPGHHMSCNGPIALEADTQLTALGFCVDPELGEMDTPNGHMMFLQAVALTEDEMFGQMCWDGQKFLALLMEHIPLGAADLARGSLMQDASFRAAWEHGVEEDGSSTGFLYMDEIAVSIEDGRMRLRLGAGHTDILSTMLWARLSKGRKLYLQGADCAAGLERGAAFRYGMEEDSFAVIVLSEEGLRELCAVLRPHAGVYPLQSAALTVELLPTEIKDQDGNVLRTIG